METNLRVLKPSRVKPKEGDVFALQIGDRFLFGRVINTQAKAGWSMPGAILIYVFSTQSTKAALPDKAVLQAENLLIPPILTNTLPWVRGYFQTITNIPLSDGQVLQRHCFKSTTGKYFDETATELPGPLEPCGQWGLHSYRTIDDEVSAALGIPKA